MKYKKKEENRWGFIANVEQNATHEFLDLCLISLQDLMSRGLLSLSQQEIVAEILLQLDYEFVIKSIEKEMKRELYDKNMSKLIAEYADDL